MPRLCVPVFVLLAVHDCVTTNMFENINEFIVDCKKEVLRVDSSESLENFDKNMAKCFTACLYTKLDLLSNDGEFNLENLSHYLLSMGRYLSDRHKIAYKSEYVEMGLDCVSQVQEDDICELVALFESCWHEKLNESMSKSDVIECIESDE